MAFTARAVCRILSYAFAEWLSRVYFTYFLGVLTEVCVLVSASVLVIGICRVSGGHLRHIFLMQYHLADKWILLLLFLFCWPCSFTFLNTFSHSYILCVFVFTILFLVDLCWIYPVHHLDLLFLSNHLDSPCSCWKILHNIFLIQLQVLQIQLLTKHSTWYPWKNMVSLLHHHCTIKIM